ncbi:unnamed protein product [Lactuca virosa]|uniref:Retroviral polymerase SH3-like domain-containing protein n=1 Tax=Lactuca virosa TaxID=75947 RepID=A0AAU9N573_9ASTR|nr:unnamed protein product [Lactuca virosa]
MDFRSTPCTFLGYSPLHHGYRCLDTSTDRIYIARHVRFNENVFPFKRPPPPSTTPAATYVSSLPSFIPDPTSTTTIDDSPPATPPASPITTPLAASPPLTTETTPPESFDTSPAATPPPAPRTQTDEVAIWPRHFLKEQTTFIVADDLTVTASPSIATISKFNTRGVPVDDIEVLEASIGEHEALLLIKALLTSTSALTDCLDPFRKKAKVKSLT